MIKRIVRLGLTCPEAKGLSVPSGQLVEPGDWTWIYVDGGALSLGFWDLYDRKRHEPAHGLPKNLRGQLTRAIDSAIASAFDNASTLHIASADSFLHSPCRIDERLRHYIAPNRLPLLDQATATFRALIEDNQSRRRYNKRKKVSLAGLTIRTHDLGNLEEVP